MSSKSDETLRVLFVEDAFDQALLVKAFLQEGSFDVTHTQDGDAAVQLLEDADEHWDLVVTDLNLPGTDGFAVIRAARARDPDLPIVATTGYTGAHYQEEAFRAGANELLTKPLDKDDFLGRIAALAGGGAPGGGGIVAIGGLVGDVEMGCGGALAEAAARGVHVLILPISKEMGATAKSLEAAQKAAKILGADALVDEGAMEDTARRMELVAETMKRLNPVVAYVPAIDEVHPARMEAFRIAKSATKAVETVLGYQTATTGMDFKPDRFVDVGPQMDIKMEALSEYGAAGAHRVDLAPRLAQAYARYWGRFRKFSEVEAFETIKAPS